jgi:hypothetical protein
MSSDVRTPIGRVVWAAPARESGVVRDAGLLLLLPWSEVLTTAGCRANGAACSSGDATAAGLR